MKNQARFLVTFLLSVLFIVLNSNQLNAQSVKRQSINSLGSSGKIGSISIHQSVGQSYSTKGSYDSKTGIRPGFQQPESFFLESVENEKMRLDVYPNPAAYSLTISNDELIKDASLVIIDLNGKVITNTNFSEFKSHTINCSDWANGSYFITLKSNEVEFYTSTLIISK